MSKRVVVLGSSNTDMIIKVARIPKPGETVLGGDFSMAAGGKGANQAVAAARAGGKVVFIGRVGDDMFGEQAVSGFVRDGIDVENVIRDADAPSGVALIFVDEKGENSIAVASGANANVSPSDVEASREVIASSAVLLMQLETPIETVTAAAEIASSHGVEVILNPAPAQPLDKTLLNCITTLTPNETEAEMLTGCRVVDERSAAEAAESIRKMGVKNVLITLGSKGVFAATPEYTGIIPACRIDNPVDTTAAGNVFNGVFAVERAAQRPYPDSIRFACAAAALSVTKLGAQTSAPYRKDIEAFLKKT